MANKVAPRPILEKTPAQKKKEELPKKKPTFKSDGGVYYAQEKCYWNLAIYPKGKGIKVAKGEELSKFFGKKKPKLDGEEEL